jgi:hypothetical protein
MNAPRSRRVALKSTVKRPARPLVPPAKRRPEKRPSDPLFEALREELGL